MKYLFERIRKWNQRMGVTTPPSFKIPDMDQLKLMRDLAHEEADEMLDAKSKEEVLDSLADQFFVLCGNTAKFGITYEEFVDYIKRVTISNESKFANTVAQADESVVKEANRLNLPIEDISYADIDGKYVIYNSKTGKILKSILYVEPENVEL